VFGGPWRGDSDVVEHAAETLQWIGDAQAERPNPDGALNESNPAEVFRCIFGNPFRTAAAWTVASVGQDTARRLAGQVYETRRYADFPLLADALEDAGCSDPELLGHLRGPGPHARGCWAVDLVLGKE
jgi:hypothetical protein